MNPWIHHWFLRRSFCSKCAPPFTFSLSRAHSPSFPSLSLSLQCFGGCPVAMKQPQQWPLSAGAHCCPRNACLIVARFDGGGTQCLVYQLNSFRDSYCRSLWSSGVVKLGVISNCLHLLSDAAFSCAEMNSDILCRGAWYLTECYQASAFQSWDIGHGCSCSRVPP